MANQEFALVTAEENDEQIQPTFWYLKADNSKL
jgi:hypothetical protein